jgi:hypothetical protein
MTKSPFLKSAVTRTVKDVIQNSITKTIKNVIKKAISSTTLNAIGKVLLTILRQSFKGIKFIFKSLFKVFKGIYTILFTNNIEDALDTDFIRTLAKNDPKMAKSFLDSNGKYISDSVREAMKYELNNTLKNAITDASPDIIRSNIDFLKSKDITGKSNLEIQISNIKGKSIFDPIDNQIDNLIDSSKKIYDEISTKVNEKFKPLTSKLKDSYSNVMIKGRDFVKKYKKRLIVVGLSIIPVVGAVQNALERSMDKELFKGRITSIVKDEDPNFLIINYELEIESSIIRWKDGDTIVLTNVTGTDQTINGEYLFYSEGVTEQNQVRIKANKPNIVIKDNEVGGEITAIYEFYDEISKTIQSEGSDCSIELDRSFNNSCDAEGISKIRYNIITPNTGIGLSCIDMSQKTSPEYTNWIQIDNQIVGEKICKSTPISRNKIYLFAMAIITIIIIYLLFTILDRFFALLNLKGFKVYK